MLLVPIKIPIGCDVCWFNKDMRCVISNKEVANKERPRWCALREIMFSDIERGEDND